MNRTGNRRVVRLVQLALGAVVVVLAVRYVLRHWDELRRQSLDWEFHPLPLVAALLLTWAMYALQIQAWRVMLRGWGAELPPLAAARIWTVSGLGKYLPGKVWAIAGMALMSQRAGVPAWVSTGSSVILQALAVGTGAVIVGATGTARLEGSYPWIGDALLALAVASVVGIAVLLWPPATRRILRLAGIDAAHASAPRLGSVLFGVACNLVAWAGYGTAFWLMARGLLPATAERLPLGVAIGAFTASYVAGLLAIFAPGGVGVREGLVLLMLGGPLGTGAALALAAASRVMLTITEFGAAAPFVLFSGERPRGERSREERSHVAP